MITKQNLLQVLELHKGDDFHFTKDREYHDPVTIVGIVREVIGNMKDDESLSNNDNDDIREGISENADSATPIYNHNLAEWFGSNWKAYDEIAEEFGKASMGENIMRGIAIAYCMTLEREAWNAWIEIYNEADKANED